MKNLVIVLLLGLTNVLSAKSPIALEFTFLTSRAGQIYEINSNDNLYDGDRIFITIKPSQACYVYMVNQDAAGTINILFPQKLPSIHALTKQKEYYIPEKGEKFQLDAVVGQEHFYLIASKKPLNDLEKLMLPEGEKEINKDKLLKKIKKHAQAAISKGHKLTLEMDGGLHYEGLSKQLSGKGSFFHVVAFNHLERVDAADNISQRGLKKKNKKKAIDMTGTAGQHDEIDAP